MLKMQQLNFMTKAREENRNEMFQMINMILWKLFDHKTHKKGRSNKQIAEAPSINRTWFEMTATRFLTFLKEKKTTLFCLINRISHNKLVVDWWSLQNGKVTWRQASSQSQARAWGTLSKLQTGDSSICNTEEPVYSRVHRSDTHALHGLYLETTVEGFNWCKFRQNRLFLLFVHREHESV